MKQGDDVMFSNTTIHLGWLDRLRALFGRGINVWHEHRFPGVPEGTIGEIITAERTSVAPVFHRRQTGDGYEPT